MQNPRLKSWDYDKLIEKKSKIITKPILKKKKLIQNDKIIKENEPKKKGCWMTLPFQTQDPNHLIRSATNGKKKEAKSPNKLNIER